MAKSKSTQALCLDQTTNATINEIDEIDVHNCLECNSPIDDNSPDGSIECPGCGKWAHQKCSNVKKTQFKILGQGNIQLLWLCLTCLKRVFPHYVDGGQRPDTTNVSNEVNPSDLSINNLLLKELREIKHELVDIKSQYNKRIDILEEQVTLLNTNNKDIHKRLTEVEFKQQTRGSNEAPSTNSNTETIIKESVERIRRQNNIIINGLPEQKSIDEDRTECHNLLTEIDVSNFQICEISRLGKPNDNTPRPLKVKFSDPKTKFDIFNNASKLRINRDNPYRQVYVGPDYTPGEAHEQFLLREEMRERTKLGEKNLKIRRGKIVTISQDMLPIRIFTPSRKHQI